MQVLLFIFTTAKLILAFSSYIKLMRRASSRILFVVNEHLICVLLSSCDYIHGNLPGLLAVSWCN